MVNTQIILYVKILLYLILKWHLICRGFRKETTDPWRWVQSWHFEMFPYPVTTRGLSAFKKQKLFDPGLLTLPPTHLLASPCFHLEIFNCHSFFLSASFYLSLLQRFLPYYISISFILFEMFPGTVGGISGSKQFHQHHHLSFSSIFCLLSSLRS